MARRGGASVAAAGEKRRPAQIDFDRGIELAGVGMKPCEAGDKESVLLGGDGLDTAEPPLEEVLGEARVAS